MLTGQLADDVWFIQDSNRTGPTQLLSNLFTEPSAHTVPVSPRLWSRTHTHTHTVDKNNALARYNYVNHFKSLLAKYGSAPVLIR